MAEVGTQREDMAPDLLLAQGAMFEGADSEGVAQIMNAGSGHARTLPQSRGTHELQEDRVDCRIAETRTRCRYEE